MRLGNPPHRVYETRVVKDRTGTRVALWAGDAGYETADADVAGARHRLVLSQSGFSFEYSLADDVS